MATFTSTGNDNYPSYGLVAGELAWAGSSVLATSIAIRHGITPLFWTRVAPYGVVCHYPCSQLHG